MWRRVNIQVPVFAAVIVVPLSYSMFIVQYKITCRDMLCSLNNQAEHIYTYIGERSKPDTFKHISTREDVLEKDYTRMHDRFQRIREITGVIYLYTTKTDENEELIYIMDCLDPGAEDFRYPGDPIKRRTYSDMERAMQGEIVILEEIKKTDQGKIFTTYMPTYEGDEAIGVIGIEFRIDRQCRTYQSSRRTPLAFILLFSLIAYLVPGFLFRRISSPLYGGMSNMDYLTQLENGDTYQLDMNNLEAKKMESGTGSILIDLNSLKHINDTLGHDVGDRYITCISKACLNTHAREGVTYRVGGDEFVVMMPKATQAGIEDFVARPKKELDKLASWPEFAFSRSSAIFDEEADNNLFSTCHRADKSTCVKEQKYYEGKKT